jgi:hypothetical protein
MVSPSASSCPPAVAVSACLKLVGRPLADFIHQRNRRPTVKWLGVKEILVAQWDGVLS